jgi:MFS superfamily sulfate permease-like transporter
VVRFEAPLVYANASRFHHVLHDLPATRPGLRRIVLDAEMVSDIDSTGAEALAAIDDELAAQGIELVIARLHERGRAQLERSRLDERFVGRSYPAVHDAARI